MGDLGQEEDQRRSGRPGLLGGMAGRSGMRGGSGRLANKKPPLTTSRIHESLGKCCAVSKLRRRPVPGIGRGEGEDVFERNLLLHLSYKKRGSENLGKIPATAAQLNLDKD